MRLRCWLSPPYSAAICKCLSRPAGTKKARVELIDHVSTLVYSILHLRAKGTQSIHTNSNSLTERPDWTNNFGKPLEEGKKGFSLGSNSIRPKLHLSRLHDTGVSYLSDTGTDRPSVSFVDNDSSDAPMIPAQVSVTEQKTFEVDTMTEEESDWVDRRASV